MAGKPSSKDGGTFLRLPTRGQLLRALTLTQNTSAMAFTIFLVPHLASPVVAAFAGLDGAEKTMMIARDLYLPLEPIVVYIPLTIHLLSSLGRRLLLSTSTSLSKSVRFPTLPHQIFAYPLAFLLIPHIITHRLIPSSPAPPIRELSPSELGWEFVGYNLQNWGAWIAYLGLVGAGVWHALVGGMKVATWLKNLRRRPAKGDPSNILSTEWKVYPDDKKECSSDPAPRIIPKPRKLDLRGLIMVLLGVVSIGLARVTRDTGLVSGMMKRRYDAVFDATPWANLYRLL
ncbi:hypothetical protein C351_06789 [Cryptococcus neoformans c8]|nr:hypothetical protein C353_06812 [Cryptococcus neoformans var. grubii AD1-83a]OXG43739.1 hypothetical protein C354_06791 [Cryptococcus neoformans var. grubii MW-RSA1955]OXG47823.1 hypothetical protein C352_06812 [Cryptococcus neoformans var. grubii CHC193]OXG56454.1 hypothetical protein C351_06789 [Cryptococcus neoformans var. grubii c8]OXH01040.1 hypothetical protein C369_06926 [Cryptococcus neoformans var. grubii A5-35-17]OXH10848.1 hypothetical protein C370_03810 [Cryptococcus neoformans 